MRANCAAATMQFSRISFKAGSKFRAPFHSGRPGTTRRSVSTPMSGIAVLDFVRRWWSISLRRTPGLLRREAPVSFAASGSSFLFSRSSWIIPVEIQSFESVGRGSSFYSEKLFAGIFSASARAWHWILRVWNCTFKFRSLCLFLLLREFERNGIILW